MSRINYEVPILDDEGNQYAEFDANVEFTIELVNGEPAVCIDSFEVESTKGKVKTFSSNDDDIVVRSLFFRGKEGLEKDDAFLECAYEKDDTIAFHGKGANDPDGHFTQVAS